MPQFVVGTPLETAEPNIEVTVDPEIPLSQGRHSFQLVVEDDSGNRSNPDTVSVVVKDSTNPTAVLEAPREVEFGASFSLDGRRSSDVPPGKVVKYIWTLVE